MQLIELQPGFYTNYPDFLEYVDRYCSYLIDDVNDINDPYRIQEALVQIDTFLRSIICYRAIEYGKL